MRGEQIRQRNALRLGLDPVDLGVELRHIGLIARNRKAHTRRLHDRALQSADRILQRPEAQSGPVLHEEPIAGAVAESENRRGHQ
jgi:hypothetical protein